jgi:hypothetical protein
MPFEAPVTIATLTSKTPHSLFPLVCSIVVKTLRAAPAMLAPLCQPVVILSMLEGSRLIVVVLYQDCTAINDNGLPSSESFLHQEQIGLRDLGSFADSANRETVAHTLV